MRAALFLFAGLAILTGGFGLTLVIDNPYYFYAGFTILQFVTIATAWNILGGYAGYINFGAAGFYGAGVYTAAFLFKALGAPLIAQIAGAAMIGLILGVVMGWLTLRIQGVYFAVATLALVVVLETLVHAWPYLGGSRGLRMLAPRAPAWAGGPTQFMFLVMLTLSLVAVGVAIFMERSWIGRGLRALRASEPAAECAGVPTMRLKLIACAASGALLAAAGAPYGFYASFIEPNTAFSLSIGLNAIAMPLVGGTASWLGPVIGAALLGTAQQVTTVLISSEINLLALGLVLIAFVILAPDGLVGLGRRLITRRRAP